jgi:hypothetical protein
MLPPDSSDHLVRHFRQLLLWPLQLMPVPAEQAQRSHWQLLEDVDAAHTWSRVADEFTADPSQFQERHYKEFVSFLPYVQRFLYGESRGARPRTLDGPPGESAFRVYRRHDITTLRVILREGNAPLLLKVAHIDLYFFDDVEVAMLNVEVMADDLPLAIALDLMYRFGRAYPTSWDEHGNGVHNVWSAEWLDAAQRVRSISDSGNRAKYLEFACQYRAAGTAAHWAFLVEPLVLDASDQEGLLRYRQIAYHRMPLMAYLAIDDPRAIADADWVRLGLIASVHPDEAMPYNDSDIAGFFTRYSFDRYWTGTSEGPNTRFLCSGRVLSVIGDARSPYFLDLERGLLGQFRHQYFMLFLIAHFQQAALLVFSDYLVDAIHDLDVHDRNSIRRFRLRVHTSFDSFLRFTHRYWFNVLSEHPHMQALHRACVRHLGNDELYAEVKEELRDMSQYLDSDAQRRQSTTVTRLTVVTTFSLIGTVATGFLGMNIIDEAHAPIALRLLYLLGTVATTTALTFYLVRKSRRLSDLMDRLSNEKLPPSRRAAQDSIGRRGDD